MALSYTQRHKLKDILWTIVFYVVCMNLYMVCRFWRAEYSWEEFGADTFLATLSAVAGGFIVGFFNNSILYERFRRQSFGWLIAVMTLVDLGVIFLVFMAVSTLTRALFFEGEFLAGWYFTVDYMFTLAFLGLIIYLLLNSGLHNFLRQASRKFGSGVMIGMLTGKYHEPREEERIFMFLDLRDSTTFAERLGHITYSRLIQDCFYDLNLLLLPYGANLYKYVGDEAILIWPMEKGLKDADCLRLYNAFHARLKEREAHYLKHYGILPEFKAGLNAGRVTVAEVGEYRREIEYHGDVLNTAARIQGKCNAYGKDLLLGESIWKDLRNHQDFLFEEIGTVELKGKAQLVKVFSAEERKEVKTQSA